MKMAKFNPLFTIFFVSVSLYNYSAFGQSQAPAPSDAGADCNGIFISYRFSDGRIIHPIQPTNQPYRFESTLTVRNNGLDDLKGWRVFVGFQNDEVLVSASNAVVVGGSSLPALVGHGAVFAGFPTTDLKSAIETAGDTAQMEAVVELVGTQFRVKSPDAPLPANMTLANDGYLCPPQPNRTIGSNELQMCCIKDVNFKSNITVGDQFLPRQQGDLVIMYDVTRMYDTNYLAQVTLSNHNPLGRIDNWKLSWEWMRQEFIFSMKGAYPQLVDTSDCVFGPQGQFYQGMDFAQALSCDKRPTIQDLPPTMANDSDRGKIPFCCRNGTLIPNSIDPDKSVSIFQMQVFKMPPDVNRTEVLPPQNWGISGTNMNTDYQCGSPARVSPSQFPDPSGLPSFSSAFASWQVVCNKTEPKTSKCCVSFSSFFNESVVPCKTCACGCSANVVTDTCSVTAPALLERPQDLFVPFDNRTEKTVEWNRLQSRAVPDPLPCGDNCGVSIHWHLNSDFKDGWSARVTLFNWGEVDFADWFAALQFDKAVPGFEAVYSFNGTALSVPNNNNNNNNKNNNTLIMYGLEGSNFLLGEKDGKNPKKDPRVPGMQQSVISFKKKPTPGIDVAARDGFPTKVIFNGMECSLPEMVPSNARKIAAMTNVLGLLIALVFLSVQ